jgi:dephospho-CoA kinase
MHARYLCRDYEVLISPKRNYGVGYKEPRIFDRDKLLKESLKDATSRWMKTISNPKDGMLFIEDTSVIIHALSKEHEYPGVDIKYWMKEHNFASVDAKLKAAENNRRVTVRSDIALYLPEALAEREGVECKIFTSSISGHITEREHIFETNPLYPWLDNKSFNKWFIPDGCEVPVSVLPIKEADRYDFRAGNFQEMLEYLSVKHIIRKKTNRGNIGIRQESLPTLFTPAFFVCGLPCAGKTTIGNYLAENANYYHIEASDFMHLSYYERHGIASSVSVHDFAEHSLQETPGIVVDQLIENMTETGDIPFVITGFRSPAEIELFFQRYERPLTIEVVYIEADASLRFNRCIKRARYDSSPSEQMFHHRDEQQLNMGLQEIRKRWNSNVIFNNTDINMYIRRFCDKYGLTNKETKGQALTHTRYRPDRLEDAVLIMLFCNKEIINEYLTTTQIAHHINQYFDETNFSTSKNNVSRYFNQKFHAYYEIRFDKDKVQYRLSQTGISKALLLLKSSRKKHSA